MVNVLILEDDPIIALDIKSIVDDLVGFNGFIASDMPSALKIAHKHTLYILLADIHIKGLVDGIDTARTLQHLYHSQLIFLTSYSDEPTLARASELNVSGYILKPFREEDLVASLKLCALKLDVDQVLLDIGYGYIYDTKLQQLFLHDTQIVLAPKEQQLFLLLLNSRGRVVPLSYIDDVIWYDESVSDTTRRQLLHRIRTKLPELTFEIVKYSGYKMNL